MGLSHAGDDRSPSQPIDQSPQVGTNCPSVIPGSMDLLELLPMSQELRCCLPGLLGTRPRSPSQESSRSDQGRWSKTPFFSSFLSFQILDKVIYSSGRPPTYSVTEDDPGFLLLLPLSSEQWNCKFVSLCQLCVHMFMCALACEGQRTIFGDVPQVPSTFFFFERGSVHYVELSR